MGLEDWNFANADTGTKYPAQPLGLATLNGPSFLEAYFVTRRLMIPRRHFLSARKTPDPEPWGSVMRVLNFVRNCGAINNGEMI